MGQEDRAYFAKRAAEEQELAMQAGDGPAAHAHRKMQRIYLERALVGGRPGPALSELVG